MQAQLLAFAATAYMAANGIEKGARAAFPAATPPEKGGLTGTSAEATAARRLKSD
jgi:hypothetical protein